MLQNSFMMGGRLDRYSDWRLDIDHMSYEVVYIPLVAFKIFISIILPGNGVLCY